MRIIVLRPTQNLSQRPVKSRFFLILRKSEALKKINEADLLTIDGFGLGTLTAQEQSLVFEITKSRADNLSTIIVS